MTLACYGIALAVALVAVALVFTWRRQRLLAGQLEALRTGLDQVRLDVAHLNNPHGPRGLRVQPRAARRKRHLRLLQGSAAALAVGGSWAREHRTVTVMCLAAAVAVVAVFTAVRAGAVDAGTPDPRRTQAVEQLLLEGVDPATAGTIRRAEPGPSPATARPSADGAAEVPLQVVLEVVNNRVQWLAAGRRLLLDHHG